MPYVRSMYHYTVQSLPAPAIPARLYGVPILLMRIPTLGTRAQGGYSYGDGYRRPHGYERIGMGVDMLKTKRKSWTAAQNAPEDCLILLCVPRVDWK